MYAMARKNLLAKNLLSMQYIFEHKKKAFVINSMYVMIAFK